eukprot:XP_011679226.1 PREDICTED: rabenosyn-5-like [Strongylocentrotus purpuratus]
MTPFSGASRSHFESLRRIRSDRMDRTVVEINKLVIRLEKLIKHGPPMNDQAKRKVYEKTIVPWAEDSDVRFCPSCGDKFSLAVRRHHCRLCGSIMCNKCSSYVGIPFCDLRALRQCFLVSSLVKHHAIKPMLEYSLQDVAIFYFFWEHSFCNQEALVL